MWPAADKSASARRLFGEVHGRAPEVVGRAPGRVNLIGEHTDYNDGLCLPLALPHATYAAVGVRDDLLVSVTSAQTGETWSGKPGDAKGWAAYAAGVVWALREAGRPIPGLDIAVDSAVPVGAGLSSSAALECAVAVAAAGVVDGIPADVLVAAARRAETELAGAPTGGMDQTIALHAQADHALLLDFDTGAREPVPWRPTGHALLVIDTGVAHDLAAGEYAARRADCAAAARALGVPSLRAATLADLADRDEPWVRRARHVVTENQRVLDFVSAARAADWADAGWALTASHLSLRDDYEVSCPELDAAVDAALDVGALGARMTGGGFGGCAIALLPQDRVEATAAAVDAAYSARGWRAPTYLLAHAAGPAMLVSAD